MLELDASAIVMSPITPGVANVIDRRSFCGGNRGVSKIVAGCSPGCDR